MSLSRDQFIKRLEEVGAILQKDPNDQWEAYLIKDCCTVYINKKHNNIFQYNYDLSFLYSFDELEQFLIDKGIVEPKFDAHDYLLSKGFKLISLNTLQKNNHVIQIYNNLKNLQVNKIEKDKFYNCWIFQGVTKESCDKAIGLIKYLESIE